MEHEKPIIDVHRALDFLCFGHWANYARIHQRKRHLDGGATDRVGLRDDCWARRTSRPCRSSFSRRTRLMRSAVPQEACAWVNPNDAVVGEYGQGPPSIYTERLSPASWFEGEETDLTMIELGNGAWIEELT